MDKSFSRLWELVMNREAWRAAVHGSQRVGDDWATELNWTELKIDNLEEMDKFLEMYNLSKLNQGRNRKYEQANYQ